ncbi:kinase-like domain-containing protein [Rhizophagus irregularis DAOM 181602=DAOM 197198]|nr:kinase-like domain-containing protein [Rhizophagus irregularis DAOM 181602=DAOM 197198]
MELVNLQQNSTLQNEEFAKKENTLQIQIKNLQSEKQALDGKLTEQLKQNSQLNQEKNNLQDKLVQTEAIIQELKSQQDQFKNQLIQIEEENFKLENELVDLQQKNFKFEQNNQNLRLNLAIQIKKFAEKENVLQTQIIDLQNEMQFLIDNLTKQLEQNKQTNQQIQVQVSQLKQEKFDLQEKLIQTEVNIQELKSQQESLTEQKEQLENKLSQSQVNCEQIEQEKIRLHNMVKGLSQEQKLTTKLKTKLEKEIAQLEQKLIIEEQIKMQLTQALQIKDDKINELEKKLVTLDQERIKQLKDKVKELNKIEKELLNKLTSGENTKEIHKEKEAKQKEMNELQQELSRTSDSYDANRKKLIISQVNNFLKVKGDFLTLREEAIKKLQNCCNHLESSINKERNTISSIRDLKTSKLTDKYTKEFQSILVKYNDGLLELNKDYYFLKNVVQENKELEVSLMIENILKLNFFNLDKYKIFKFATNSQEGTRIQLNSNMMEEDINSLRKNLNELKLELNQEKNELKNLATV